VVNKKVKVTPPLFGEVGRGKEQRGDGGEFVAGAANKIFPIFAVKSDRHNGRALPHS